MFFSKELQGSDIGAIFRWVQSDDCTNNVDIERTYSGTDRNIATRLFQVLKDESDTCIFKEQRKDWNPGQLRAVALAHAETPFTTIELAKNFLAAQERTSKLPGAKLVGTDVGDCRPGGSNGSFGSASSMGTRAEAILAFVLTDNCKTKEDIKKQYSFAIDVFKALEMFAVCKDPNSMFASIRTEWDEETLAAVALAHAQNGFNDSEEVKQFVEARKTKFFGKFRAGTKYKPF